MLRGIGGALLVHPREERRRIPDRRYLRRLHRLRPARHLVVLAIRLPTERHVLLPRHAVDIEQLEQVGPWIPRGGPRLAGVRGSDAAACVASVGAGSRPLADEIEVCGQRIAPDAREQAVLQDEVFRVQPVVRNILDGVIAHHVVAGLSVHLVLAASAVRVLAAVQLAPPENLLRDEAIHQVGRRAVVEVDGGVERPMRAAGVDVVGVVERRDATQRRRGQIVRQADTAGNAVGAGIGPEVTVEAAVLLHDDDDVLDGVRHRGRAGAGPSDEAAESCQDPQSEGCSTAPRHGPPTSVQFMKRAGRHLGNYLRIVEPCGTSGRRRAGRLLRGRRPPPRPRAGSPRHPRRHYKPDRGARHCPARRCRSRHRRCRRRARRRRAARDR